jgi:CheY-like chemotaxis protein
MTPEVLERIFEPFFTTKGPGRGTGPGLATVYGIVKAHGGLIHCWSAPSRGTVFSVFLPFGGSEEAAQEPPPGHGETILVAEDESVVRALTVRILETAGYRVIEASDGAEAVRLFRLHASEVAAAVIDAVMPELDGRGAARRMREVRPDLPVVFATGHDFATLEDVTEGRERSSIIHKPYRAQELLLRVRRAVEAAADTADRPPPRPPGL